MSAAGTGRSPPVWCRMAARPGGCLSPREKHFFKVIPAWGRVSGGAGREMQASWVELVMSFLVPAMVPSKWFPGAGGVFGWKDLRGRGRKRTAVAEWNVGFVISEPT